MTESNPFRWRCFHCQQVNTKPTREPTPPPARSRFRRFLDRLFGTTPVELPARDHLLVFFCPRCGQSSQATVSHGRYLRLERTPFLTRG